MAITNSVLATTLRRIVKETRDSTTVANVLYDYLKRNGSVDVVNGGQAYSTAPIVAEHSSITEHSTGYEPVTFNPQTIFRRANWAWQHATVPVGISKAEELENQGDAAVINILSNNVKNGMYMFVRNWEQHAIEGGVFTDMDTLNGNLAGGFFEPRAYGAQTNTVGGIDRAVYNVWGHQFVDATSAATFAADPVAYMSQLYQECSWYGEGSKSYGPDLFLMSPVSWRAVKSVTATREFLTKQLDLGRVAILWNGAELLSSPYMPLTNISALALRTDTLRAGFLKGGQFDLGGFNERTGYSVRSANIYMAAALGSIQFRGSGVLYNAG